MFVLFMHTSLNIFEVVTKYDYRKASNPMLWTHLPQITHYWKLQPNMPYNKSRWLHITERKLRKRTHDI